jgi:hypothetical protein
VRLFVYFPLPLSHHLTKHEMLRGESGFLLMPVFHPGSLCLYIWEKVQVEPRPTLSQSFIKLNALPSKERYRESLCHHP